MGWFITLGVLLLLAVLPLGIRVSYDSGGPLVKVIAGPLKLTVYPRHTKRKKDKPKKEQKPAARKQTEEASLPRPPQPPKPVKEKKPAEKKGGSLRDFIPFVKLGLSFLGDFRRKLRLNNLELKLVLASSDPCDLAVNYGKTWAAVGNLLPALERWFVIKKRNVEVECDFTASQTLVTARLDISITLGRLLGLAAVYGVQGLKEFLNFKKKRKGGAQQ